MELSTRTRRAISTALAVLLAAESVSVVAAAAATTRSVTHALPADPPAGVVLAARARPALPSTGVLELVAQGPRAASAPGTADLAKRDRAALRALADAAAAEREAAARAEAKAAKAAARDKAREASRAKQADRSKAAPKARSSAKGLPAFHGSNHVWIPSLGISRSVRWFPCDRQRPPDNYMYRWGCAGTNNVYLMGHAYSIMKPLHDAYVTGRLRKGMTAWYADARGKVHAYKVIWWRKTLPTTDAAWAWASQSRPSMTLQTCVGKNSRYRLMVRLVRVS